jgi:outer membrane receptor protein involved in Fe transport
MKPNDKLSRTIAAILAASAMPMALAAGAAPVGQTVPAPAPSQAGSSDTQALQPIIVTATRRRESVQSVPVTMQVLTGQMMRQLHIASFEDLRRMVPNLTSADQGPGQNEIFIRGIGAGSHPTQVSGTISIFPNVGVYLDNQSVEFPSQNLDIYAVDLSRIEVLEGPQGTLFGSGAEAGAIRYITNKPALDDVEGNVSGSYGVTAHGDPNTAVSGVLNLPIVPHHMAMRFVVYDDRRGGYINSLPGTFTRHDTDLGIHYANYPAVNGQCPDGGANNGYCVPPGSVVANNAAMVGNHINPLTYQGARIEALYQFNDDWSFLVTQMNQNMDAEGVFFQYPNAPDGQPLAPLSVVLFAPSYHKERWSNTAWTLKGKAGPLSLIYTGGLLTRSVENQADYTNYARAVYADYYQCLGPGPGNANSTCFTPVSTYRSDQQNRHWQHELRVQTPNTWRLRGILGAYQEDNVAYDQSSFYYKSVPTCTSNGAPGTPGNTDCFSPVGTFPGATVRNPGVQPDGVAFDSDEKREERQIAEFASVSFDLLPNLTLTGGTRHFVFFNSLAGNVLSSFGCFEAGLAPGGCTSAFSTNVDAQHLRDTESGWRSQANLSWHVDPDLFGNQQHILTYVTFSQGFRPGAFNQNGGSLHIPGPDGQPQFAIPTTYHSDTLNNYEVGWKTDWRLFDRYFQWNAAFYREDWNNVEINFFQPGLTGLLSFSTNGQNFRIDGAETSFIAQLWRGLTLRGTGAWNSSEQLNSPALIDNNPASVNFGKPITQVCNSGPASCTPVTNPFGPRGAPTSDSPPIRYTLLLRYDFPLESPAYFGSLDGAVAHVQFGMEHQGHSFTQAGSNPPFIPGEAISTVFIRFEDPAYTLYDASVGVSKDRWSFAVYGENLTNSHAAVFTSTANFIEMQTPLRPRIIGARFGYSF